MAFKDPQEGGDYEPTLPEGVVTIQVVGTREGKDYGYGPTIEWFFNVWGADGVQYLDEDGNAWELQQLSSETLTKNDKGASKAREWGEVLLGGDLDDLGVTDGAEFGEAIVGKAAKALIAYSDKGFERIMNMRPLDAPAAAAPAAPAAPTPAAAPAASPAPPPAAEPDDLPF